MVNFGKKYKNTDSFTDIPLKTPKKVLPGMSGIYRIHNKINGKSYIGQSIDIRRRAFSHNRNLKNNKYSKLYLAIKKYGIDSFYISIVATINIDGSRSSSNIKLELNILETMYVRMFDSFLNGYNGSYGGDSGKIGYRHSEQTIEKIKQSLLNRKEKSGIVGSIKAFGYDFVLNKEIEADSISEMTRLTGVDERSITSICKKINGRVSALKKRFTFSFTEEGLVTIVEYIKSGRSKEDSYKKRSIASKLKIGSKYKKRNG